MRHLHYLGLVLLLALGGIPAFVVAGAMAGLPVFVYPPVDPMPARADVVYVIGPPTRGRLLLARELIDSGVSDTMLISVSANVLEPGGQVRKFGHCNTPGSDVICISPTPFTTRGESAALEHIARQRGWHSAVVITQTAHVLRTRMFMNRCFHGDVTVVASREPSGLAFLAYQYIYQTSAFVKSALEDAC